MASPKTQSLLVTSYKIFVTAADSQKREIGQLQSINPSESRDVTDSFVLGNNPPDEPFELIPGVVRSRRLAVTYVSLYTKELQKALGRDDQDVVTTLSENNTPFDIVETVTNPNTSQSKTRIYQGCFIQDYSATRDIGRGDIREIQTATIVYKRVTSTDFQ